MAEADDGSPPASPRDEDRDGADAADDDGADKEQECKEEAGTLSLRAAIRMQCSIRRFLCRVRVVKKLRDRVEKIYDIKRGRFYYYDTVTDMSSWSKHRLFGRHDVKFISPTYTPETAALLIQTHIRRYLARLRVRLLYQTIVTAVPDARTGGTYFYNSAIGQAMWELPKFMKGKLTHKRRADRRPGDSSGDESDGDDESSKGSDSEADKLRRKMARKFPRSVLRS
jgi:hypothetical protein